MNPGNSCHVNNSVATFLEGGVLSFWFAVFDISGYWAVLGYLIPRGSIHMSSFNPRAPR
jgi:hypothetical protein